MKDDGPAPAQPPRQAARRAASSSPYRWHDVVELPAGVGELDELDQAVDAAIRRARRPRRPADVDLPRPYGEAPEAG